MRKVLRQLDSEKLEERDQAEKRLIEIGPSVIPYLPEVKASTSGELRFVCKAFARNCKPPIFNPSFKPAW